jgi:integrase
MDVKRRDRRERRLKAKDIEKLGPGTYEDGGGLRLVVEPSGARRWVLRVTINGKRRNRGLGSAKLVTLEAAREDAFEIRRAAHKGRDLKDERRQQAAKATTFKEAFEIFFESKRQSLSSAKHVEQYRATMEAYVIPVIGYRQVSSIGHSDIIEVLKPIWFKKSATAKLVLQHIEAVFTMAFLRGWCEKASPCIGVAQELGTRRRNVKHRQALPYAEVQQFIETLRDSPATPVTKLAFEWLILTATRSNETRGAAWPEIDEANFKWIIPAERMKKRHKEHVVPLSDRCLEILSQARVLNPDSAFLFPSERTRRPLSERTFTKLLSSLGLTAKTTVHGFRSTFRVWVAEQTDFPREIAEAALSHAIPIPAEAAYVRTDFFDKRRELMRAWADYCCSS